MTPLRLFRVVTPAIDSIAPIYRCPDDDGVLDFDEVVAGLSVLCAGAGPDKARAIFDLFDYDGDGAVTEAEVARYMTAVFRVCTSSAVSVFAHQPLHCSSAGHVCRRPSARGHAGGPRVAGAGNGRALHGRGRLGQVRVEHMHASVQVSKCVRSRLPPRDGLLSFAEFRDWYAPPSTGPARLSRQPSAPAAPTEGLDAAVVRTMQLETHDALCSARRVLHLHMYSAMEVLDTCAENMVAVRAIAGLFDGTALTQLHWGRATGPAVQEGVHRVIPAPGGAGGRAIVEGGPRRCGELAGHCLHRV